MEKSQDENGQRGYQEAYHNFEAVAGVYDRVVIAFMLHIVTK